MSKSKKPKQREPFYREGRQLWYVQLDGRQINLGPDRDEAWKRYHELMAARAKEVPAPTARSAAATQVVAVLEQFMEKYASAKAERTYEYYQRALKSFRLALPAGLTVEGLAPAHVTDWLAGHKDWSPSTRHGAIHAVKKAVRWGCKEWKLGPSPLADVEAPTPTRREAVITPEQWPHVLGAATDQEFRDLLTFLWETGARPQEATHAEARHLDAAHERLVFPASESKGKKFQRVIYLTPTALEVVRRLAALRPEGKLFRNENGLPWNRNAIRCRFRRQRVNGRVKVKVKGVCGYAVRHSYATNALRAGVDPITLAVLMGHADASMIAKVYQHLATDPDFLLEAARRAKGVKAPEPPEEDRPEEDKPAA